ncbi:MAG: uroporphyrinogen-III C-methyltransferase [Gammaproteobacteria bacterium]|nr:uroporphyrinogen-III C-methyltransferase [Gammaproteobacteria bacterium]
MSQDLQTLPEDSAQDAATDAPAVESNSDIKSRHGNKLSILWSIVTTLILICALVAIAWLYREQQGLTTQLQQQELNVAEQLKQRQQLLADLQAKNQALQNDIEQQATALQQQTDLNQLLRQQVVTTQDRLRLLTSQGKQEWLLEQVHYYLTLAQEKLIFENNRDVAIALLSQAEGTVAEISDLQLLDLRQAISDDLLALDAIATLDNSPVLLKINSLRENLNALVTTAPQYKNVAELDNPENKDWYDRFVTTMAKITEDAIKIRTHDEKVQPMLSKEQKSVLVATLSLALTQAQSAVLNQDKAFYDSRIQFSRALINDYFVLDDKAQSILKQLTQLESVDIQAPIRYQLKSKQQIEAIKEQRRLKWLSDQSTVSPSKEQ